MRERRLGETVSYAAVYPSVSAGTWTVLDTGQVVTITGGSITEITWSGADEPATHDHGDRGHPHEPHEHGHEHDEDSPGHDH